MDECYDNECVICAYDILKDQPYGMINNQYEKGKYHVECLEKWVNVSRNGLLTQYEIKSYSIYQHENLIEILELPENVAYLDQQSDTIEESPENTAYLDQQSDTMEESPLIETNTSTNNNRTNKDSCCILF